ncbi:MAG: peptidoglycan-binding protein [Planktomarina sp.]|nr:peptidoglycan-binding protein [Planktomarina sp.]
MHRLFLSCVCLCYASLASATCGTDWAGFIKGIKQEAVAMGYPQSLVTRFFNGAEQNPKVIQADRRQGVFQKDFISFSHALISQHRLVHAQKNAAKYATIFDRLSRDYGIPPGVLLAFWAFETDFGVNQGNFNTLNALLTLSQDCRRPELFRPQVFAALELYTRSDFDPRETKGAWAGEIGMIQMLPEDILDSGSDGDGDGRVDLQNSAEDALMSGGHMLRRLGWQAGAPWLQEIELPGNLDLTLTGLDKSLPIGRWQALGVTGRHGPLQPSAGQASVLLPVGHKGPAFLTFPNFNVYFEWNQSLVYVTTAAYFATLLSGAPRFDPGTPETGLTGQDMQALQKKLVARGHDVGKIDGILGSKTRAAVQVEQERLKLPADAWPTPSLLARL